MTDEARARELWCKLGLDWEECTHAELNLILAALAAVREECAKAVKTALSDWVTDVPEGEDLNAVIDAAIRTAGRGNDDASKPKPPCPTPRRRRNDGKL